MPSWYAVWTRARHEHRVCDELETRRVRCFLPTQMRISHWSDRHKAVRWPLFPGYCFARIDPEDAHLVTRCRGVAGVLSSGGRLAAIPDEEIDALMRLMQTDVPYDACMPRAVGTRVRVVRGPLAGVCGRLLQERQGTQLLLSVDLLNNAARLSIPVWDVEPAPAPTTATRVFAERGEVTCSAR